MARNKKTPRQAMKYWKVGYNGVVIRARTARVAARKWLRDNAVVVQAIRDHELDNPHGTGDMPHETLASKRWTQIAKELAPSDLSHIRVRQVPKGTRGPCCPDHSAFWSGFNRDQGSDRR